MSNVTLVFIVTLSIAFVASYSRVWYSLISQKKYSAKLLVQTIVLEEYIHAIESNKISNDDSIHKENFIKFLSDSRDWAFEYIEEFQAGLDEFVSSIEPEINYFKEYGDLMSMSPNYYSLKKIVDEYEKLKKLLPKQEEQK